MTSKGFKRNPPTDFSIILTYYLHQCHLVSSTLLQKKQCVVWQSEFRPPLREYFANNNITCSNKTCDKITVICKHYFFLTRHIGLTFLAVVIDNSAIPLLWPFLLRFCTNICLLSCVYRNVVIVTHFCTELGVIVVLDRLTGHFGYRCQDLCMKLL